jgi:tetratricopeptide (TPR) repeat protein
MLARGHEAYNVGDLAIASTLADEALELALHEGDPRPLAWEYQLQVVTRHSLGDFAAAEKYFTLWVEVFDNPRLKRFPGMAGTIGAASLNAWIVGHPDLACAREAEMMTIASSIGPFDDALAAYYGARLHAFMRQYERADALAERALKLAEQNQYPLLLEIPRCVLGHARAQLGCSSEGIGLIRQGMAFKTGVHNPEYTAWLAEALGGHGDVVGALRTIEQALQTPVTFPYRPEMFRIRGELRLKHGSAALAEADFREAVALARSIGAKSLELRATLHLARLLAQQRRRDEARTLLAEIYNWFTEGFDTTDLREAKALLDHLNC